MKPAYQFFYLVVKNMVLEMEKFNEEEYNDKGSEKSQVIEIAGSSNQSCNDINYKRTF